MAASAALPLHDRPDTDTGRMSWTAGPRDGRVLSGRLAAWLPWRLAVCPWAKGEGEGEGEGERIHF